MDLDIAQKKTIGILGGGGQLGRMLIEAAAPLDLQITVLDPSLSPPAAAVLPSGRHLKGDFRDPDQVKKLWAVSDIITFEIEHVDTDALIACRESGDRHVQVHPDPETVKLIQDKFQQKVHLAKHGIPLPDFQDAPTKDSIVKATQQDQFGLPLMLKSKTLAYDGRGNAVIKTRDDIDGAVLSLGGAKANLYLERWVPFEKELAVMVAKDLYGNIVSYPVVETIQRDNICHVVIAPAQIDGQIAENARKMAENCIATFQGAGIYGVEMFLLKDGNLVVNEIAPRPHNSGHYTIEACYTSQFEQHLRAISGLALGDASLKCGASIMLNILGKSSGEEGMREAMILCSKALALSGASVHWYGKSDCRAGRKMGHITLVGDCMNTIYKRFAELTSENLPRVSPQVGIIMGSDSDLPTLKPAAQTLSDFGVPFELTIVSAHRTPKRLTNYATQAYKRGLKVIIAAAGGAAHLPGMVASETCLPVIGVPVALKHLDGVDSLYSIVQMPRGIPVATVAINNAINAALLAIRILGSHYPVYAEKMIEYQKQMENGVLAKVKKLEEIGWESYEP